MPGYKDDKNSLNVNALDLCDGIKSRLEEITEEIKAHPKIEDNFKEDAALRLGNYASAFIDDKNAIKRVLKLTESQLEPLPKKYAGDTLVAKKGEVLAVAEKATSELLNKDLEGQIEQYASKMKLPRFSIDGDETGTLRELRLQEVRRYCAGKSKEEIHGMYQNASESDNLVVVDAIDEAPIPLLPQDWRDLVIQKRKDRKYPLQSLMIKSLNAIQNELTMMKQRTITELNKLRKR